MAWTATAGLAAAEPRPHLVLLGPTGQTRDGLPVLTRRADAVHVGEALTRGFSGRLLRLYALEQEFLRQAAGHQPEPAYLLLSDRQGGFPEFGFYLDGERKADAGWVDLHRSGRVWGRFGAMDQVFPHELLHVIVHQLAGEPRESGGNQVHAIGVRTDPVTAFTEGFAEHVQILAVDDADALPETRALATDSGRWRSAEALFAGYGRDLAAWWPFVLPSQIRVPLWFSQSEQVLRYHAVKANRFAREAALPESLLARQDKYAAYLFQNTAVPEAAGPPKPAAVMLSTEGVVSHLFWRFVTDRALQSRYLDDRTLGRFGTKASEVTPLENVYLKLFLALHAGRPSTTAELLRAYVRLFPDDAPDAARLVREALLGQDLPEGPEIWLANDGLMTGTSLFDQYRALPRAHTFDVNAATLLDWLSVPGVTRDAARRLVARTPYRRIEDLLAAPELTDDTRQRVTGMSAAMKALLARSAHNEESLSLTSILWPYAWRLAGVLLGGVVAGAWLARVAGVRRRWAAALVAFGASLTVVALAWVVTSPPWYPAAAPLVMFAAPWALWRFVRHRAPRRAAQAFAVWLAASIPSLLLTRPWW